MNNINIEKIKQTLKDAKKLVLQRTLPFVLATTFLFGAGTPKAEAANIEFSTISITSDDEHFKESNYESSYISDKDAEEVNKIIKQIDTNVTEFYNVMANGGVSIAHTKSKENSLARFVATMTKITDNAKVDFDDMTNTQCKIIEKYLETKINECKLTFNNVTGISLDDLEDFSKNKQCVFANSISNGLVNIGIYEIKNNSIVDSKIISIDDSKLVTGNTLVNIPQIDVVYNGNNPSFKLYYETKIIAESNLKLYNQIIGDIDIFYSKLEKALDKGNYIRTSGQDKEDIYVSLYGDTNLINQTINTKYQAYPELKESINKYLNYKQTLLASKVYDKNTMNYSEYVKYNANNTPIRISEESGFVYYQLGSKIVPIIDKGYIKTSDLQSAVSTLANTQINAYTGVNIYIDGKLYIPTDVNGNMVEPFVYNGTTYLPARAISNVFNTDIEWKNGNVYMTSKENEETYYIDENGNKVYMTIYPEIPTTNRQPYKTLINKTLVGNKGMKIFYNGNLFTPTDVNGNVVETYVFNGTTYLPVRAISNLFNAEINWNESLNGVTINRNQFTYKVPNDDYYYIDDNGNEISVPEDEIDFGNNITNKPYYFDDNGNKVYIDEDDYQKTR